MAPSRTKKVYYNIISEGVYQATVFICGLILPRYILRFYGSEYNGIISSITQFLQFISILRLGVAGATRVELYKSLGTGDHRKTSGIMKATQQYMRRIAYALCAYIGVMMLVYPFVIKSQYSWGSVASLVVIIGMTTFAEYFFGITNATLLDSDQRNYIYVWVRTAATILNVLISVFLILHGAPIQVMKLVSCLVFFACPVFLHFYVNYHYKLDKDVEPDTSALDKRRDVMASSIANIIHNDTDVIVLTLLTNPMVVSVYSVYQMVMNGLKKIMTVFTNGLEAYFGNMWVQKETDNLYKGLSHFEYFISMFISIVFSSALVLILPFITLYTKGVNDINYYIPVYAVLVVAAQAVFCFRQPYLTFVQAAGHYKETKYGSYMEAGINIVLSIALTFQFGIVGVVIGTLAANLFRSIQYAYYISKHLLPRPFITVVLRLVWAIGNVLISAGFTTLVHKAVDIAFESWMEWVIGGFISVAIGTMVSWISSLLFYRSDFSWLINKVHKLLIWKKKEK